MNLGNTKDYKNILLNNDNKLQGINVDGKFDDDFEKTKYDSSFKNLELNHALGAQLKNVKYNDKNSGVLKTINEMKQKLKDSNDANKEFMNMLSKNLQYYNTIIEKIIDKIKQIFDLIASLNKGTSVNTLPGPNEPRGQPQPPGQNPQNDELIKELVKTINSYLNEFNILKSNIDTIVGNNRILRKELSEKSNNLFGNIKELDDLFDAKFRELGIFTIDGNKLVTFNQIQNQMIKNRITRDDLNLGNTRDASFFYNFFFDGRDAPRIYKYDNRRSSQSNSTSYDIFQNILNNKPYIISTKLQLGGLKRIKNRKTKRQRKSQRRGTHKHKTKNIFK